MNLRDFAPEVPPEGDIEDQLRQRLGEHDFLLDLWQMGEQMRAFAAMPAGKYLVTTFTQRFNAALRRLLDLDFDAPEARVAHADARRYWAMLQEIEETLGMARQAEGQMLAEDTLNLPSTDSPNG